MKHNVINCFICGNTLIRSKVQPFRDLTAYVCYGENPDRAHCRQYIYTDTGKTDYYTIWLKHFYIYYYCDNNGAANVVNLKNKVHVYHSEFPKGEYQQSPFLILSTDKVDLNNILSYDEKWKILSLFS